MEGSQDKAPRVSGLKQGRLEWWRHYGWSMWRTGHEHRSWGSPSTKLSGWHGRFSEERCPASARKRRKVLGADQKSPSALQVHLSLELYDFSRSCSRKIKQEHLLCPGLDGSTTNPGQRPQPVHQQSQQPRVCSPGRDEVLPPPLSTSTCAFGVTRERCGHITVVLEERWLPQPRL